jgi:Do/DeqQ family serine protease
MMKQILVIVIAAIIGGIIAISGYDKLIEDTPPYTSIQERQAERFLLPVPANYNISVPQNLDFREVAKLATTSVVYIRSTYASSSSGGRFFQYPQGAPQSSGSGVIISDDGYIITNNHVVENARDVEVTLNDNRNYKARVIGTDPTTDLALLKINQQNLTFLPYGNSDQVEVGQWVLAVGNPMHLNSTVTAGIISAKARNIGILRDENNLEIESFLQTDAVVNPGNSGGALVDAAGYLIGINTAIQTNTGAYTGYSFAVPVNLAKKVIDDLLEFGVVQRALLGIRIGDVSAPLAEDQDLNVVKGVFVASVNNGSAAQAAGLKAGDVIIAIDNRKVDNTSELQELVARHRPGDKIKVRYIRDKKEQEVSATLRNTGGTTAVVERSVNTPVDGTVFEEISAAEQQRLGIEGGVQIKSLQPGKWEEAGFKEGFIITKVDKFKISSVDDLRTIMAHKTNERVIILGVFPDGTKSYYTLDW